MEEAGAVEDVEDLSGEVFLSVLMAGMTLRDDGREVDIRNTESKGKKRALIGTKRHGDVIRRTAYRRYGSSVENRRPSRVPRHGIPKLL